MTVVIKLHVILDRVDAEYEEVEGNKYAIGTSSVHLHFQRSISLGPVGQFVIKFHVKLYQVGGKVAFIRCFFPDCIEFLTAMATL